MKRPIALPPLDSIADPEVRAAFRALVDHFGKTDYLSAQDFLDAAKNSGGGRNQGVPLQKDNLPGVWNRPPKPGEVGAIISSLENQIRNSALFRELGTRIDLIDRPTTGLVYRIGNAEGSIRAQGAQLTGIGSEIYKNIIPTLNSYGSSLVVLDTQLSQFGEVVALVQQSTFTAANAVTSLATWSITTQATIGQIGDSVDGIKVSVQTAQLAQANVNGNMLARWTVRMDLNGMVSGFGMEASGTRQHVESMFLVRATTFAIAGTTAAADEYLTPPVRGQGLGVPADETLEAWEIRVNAWGDAIVASNNALVAAAINNPDGRAGQVQVPFIVKTDYWFDDAGIAQPPGVYMRRAMIERLVVDTAYIRKAAVTTLTIDGQAVTFPYGKTDANTYRMQNDEIPIWVMVFYNNDEQRVPCSFSWVSEFSPGSGGDGNYLTFFVTCNNRQTISRQVGYPNNINRFAAPGQCVFMADPAWNTVVLWARERGADLLGYGDIVSTTAFILGLKR